MKEGIVFIALYITIIAGFFTSVVQDAIYSRFVWVIVDILVSPIGVVRGWLMWLGLAG